MPPEMVGLGRWQENSDLARNKFRNCESEIAHPNRLGETRGEAIGQAGGTIVAVGDRDQVVNIDVYVNTPPLHRQQPGWMVDELPKGSRHEIEITSFQSN